MKKKNLIRERRIKRQVLLIGNLQIEREENKDIFNFEYTNTRRFKKLDTYLYIYIYVEPCKLNICNV